MWHNIKKNHFIIISGLETLVLGAYLIYVQHVFTPPRPLPTVEMVRIVEHAQDPWIALTLVVVGVLSIITGAWDMNHFYAKRVSLVAMVAVWVTYLVAFTVHDLSNSHVIGIGTILIAFILIRLFAEALWGDHV
ncbi:hypothetical protein IWT25_02601 [Secundilactobacillus pentosiphilus]|uniref:Uncharacterized protein n=1 Tax=Secundilactobacillus pentosiphilus TaxID=1714682 RepID=A0A1Z5IZP0_9LACO|nr:hypothetical protein [Secundilactobacillus pentosiphilus]GAX07247.1 hypothetical protein IWT25_02601 [Secundilactobacillus pentosiphilus]